MAPVLSISRPAMLLAYAEAETERGTLGLRLNFSIETESLVAHARTQ